MKGGTLVAYKLEIRDSDYYSFALMYTVEDILPEETWEAAAYQFIVQPQFLNYPQSICGGVITNALQSCSKELNASRWFPTNVLRVVSVLWL